MQIKENIEAIEARIAKTAKDCGRTPEDRSPSSGYPNESLSHSLRPPLPQVTGILEKTTSRRPWKKLMPSAETKPAGTFIGHLQSNKAKFAVKYFDLIHTVDKVKLAKEISKQAAKIDKTQNILIQINIAEEETKSGAQATEVKDLVRQVSNLPNIKIKGLMCMPPFFDDPELARPYFCQVKQLQQEIAALDLPGVGMEHLSMGMSNDFTVAVEEGATLVRVGTAIFGGRE